MELVGALSQRLGRHEGGRAGAARQQQVLARELVAHAEVCDLHSTQHTAHGTFIYMYTVKITVEQPMACQTPRRTPCPRAGRGA